MPGGISCSQRALKRAPTRSPRLVTETKRPFREFHVKKRDFLFSSGTETLTPTYSVNNTRRRIVDLSTKCSTIHWAIPGRCLFLTRYTGSAIRLPLVVCYAIGGDSVDVKEVVDG